MADETSTETTAGAETEANGTETSTDTTTDESGLPEGAKKALAAARRDARDAEKARKALEVEVQTYKQRDMTEQQKLEERAATAEKTAEESSTKLARLTAALDAGLERQDADLVTGSTAAEMKASAERLAERFGGSSTNFDGGARQSAGKPTDMNDLIRRSVAGGR